MTRQVAVNGNPGSDRGASNYRPRVPLPVWSLSALNSTVVFIPTLPQLDAQSSFCILDLSIHPFLIIIGPTEDLWMQHYLKTGVQNGKMKKTDPVGSTVRYEMMTLCTGSVQDTMRWQQLVIDETGSVEGIYAFIYCAKWRSGQVLLMPYSQTLKDRATQLRTKYKSGALVTQFSGLSSKLCNWKLMNLIGN